MGQLQILQTNEVPMSNKSEPGPVDTFIYRDVDGGLCPYTVLAGGEWPWGRVIKCTFTLWGARSAARRVNRRCQRPLTDDDIMPMILLERSNA